MSTLLFAWSAAKRKFALALLVIAKPVYTAPDFELSTGIIALLRSDCGPHPLMVPSRVANRKIDAHPCTWNSVASGEPLNTTPVGDPGPAPFAVGISTSRPCLPPPPL